MPNVPNPHEKSKAAPPESSPENRLLQELRTDLEAIRERLDQLFNQLATPLPRLLSRKEAADVLGVSTRKLDALAEAGRIQPTRIDRRVKYHPKTVQRFVRRCTEGECS